MGRARVFSRAFLCVSGEAKGANGGDEARRSGRGISYTSRRFVSANVTRARDTHPYKIRVHSLVQTAVGLYEPIRALRISPNLTYYNFTTGYEKVSTNLDRTRRFFFTTRARGGAPE